MFYLASGHQRKTQQRKEEKIWIIGMEGLMTNTFTCISTEESCPLCGLCGFFPVLGRAKPGAGSRDEVSPPSGTLGLAWHMSLGRDPTGLIKHLLHVASLCMQRVGWASPESMDHS